MNSNEVGSVVLVVIGVVMVSAGVLMIWLGRKSRNGTLNRNHIAGVRTGLTLSSDVAWYPAQRAAARSTGIAGWGSIVTGATTVALSLFSLPFSTRMLLALCLTLGGAAWLLGWAIAGAFAAQRAARDAVDTP
ncbi:putative Predicted integral membrane protein [Microbacterium sp. C448]|uniref:SdpI family protein n=1 Tax=Microbacterium sp. C448 TaxID=1177594 RepID=UPI0003DE5A46|nr:SdpI family protein [Microbacterium sp. C448]CDK01588.1 putative Predicted integral membrane protein [Microbacterium sp. C448]